VTTVPEIDVATLESLMVDAVVLVDVREDDEYTDGHVTGALPIPLATVPERFGDLPTDSPVYVICALGGRSARAAEFLRAQGIDAINVAGGTQAWVDSGRAVVRGSSPT
jgi:rhodanese-related sulfurtransferase